MRSKRFILWRRGPSDISGAVDTLEEKIDHARQILVDGDADSILVLEIKKVVSREAPVTVRDY